MALGMLVFVVNVWQAGERRAASGNDPWLGDTLEWYTTSPPPAHNFDKRAVHLEPPPAARPAAAAEEELTLARAPGCVCAALGATAAVAAPSDGAARSGRAPRPRRARAAAARRVVIAAWRAHPRLAAVALALASSLFLVAIADLVGRPLHVAAAAVALAVIAVVTAQVFRGEHVPPARGATT